MYLIIKLILLVVSTVTSVPLPNQAQPSVFVSSQTNDITKDGYSYRYVQSDGQEKYESGYLKNPGTDKEILKVYGYYSYYGPDGKKYQVNYMVDEEGFHPFGNHLPNSAGVVLPNTPAPPRPASGYPSNSYGGYGGGGYAAGGLGGGEDSTTFRTEISSAAVAAILGGGFRK